MKHKSLFEVAVVLKEKKKDYVILVKPTPVMACDSDSADRQAVLLAVKANPDASIDDLEIIVRDFI